MSVSARVPSACGKRCTTRVRLAFVFMISCCAPGPLVVHAFPKAARVHAYSDACTGPTSTCRRQALGHPVKLARVGPHVMFLYPCSHVIDYRVPKGQMRAQFAVAIDGGLAAPFIATSETLQPPVGLLCLRRDRNTTARAEDASHRE